MSTNWEFEEDQEENDEYDGPNVAYEPEYVEHYNKATEGLRETIQGLLKENQELRTRVDRLERWVEITKFYE